MNSEERDVINGIFQRLEQAAQQPRDADAERFIAEPWLAPWPPRWASARACSSCWLRLLIASSCT
jgi:hypothetical protein